VLKRAAGKLLFERGYSYRSATMVSDFGCAPRRNVAGGERDQGEQDGTSNDG
jgi:hypothetical protein